MKNTSNLVLLLGIFLESQVLCFTIMCSVSVVACRAIVLYLVCVFGDSVEKLHSFNSIYT